MRADLQLALQPVRRFRPRLGAGGDAVDEYDRLLLRERPSDRAEQEHHHDGETNEGVRA